MTDDRKDWERMKALFAEAQPLSPAERESFLNQACAGNPELRDELQELLAVEDRRKGFLEESPARVVL